MKLLMIGLFTLLVTGCSSVSQTEKEKNADDWFNYGEFRAKKGLMIQTQEKLQSMNEESHISGEFYNAYVSGHKEGTAIYCSQTSYILGISGEPYFGLCDESDPEFKKGYEQGLNHKKE